VRNDDDAARVGSLACLSLGGLMGCRGHVTGHSLYCPGCFEQMLSTFPDVYRSHCETLWVMMGEIHEPTNHI
jgi:hypothetical protein